MVFPQSWVLPSLPFQGLSPWHGSAFPRFPVTTWFPALPPPLQVAQPELPDSVPNSDSAAAEPLASHSDSHIQTQPISPTRSSPTPSSFLTTVEVHAEQSSSSPTPVGDTGPTRESPFSTLTMQVASNYSIRPGKGVRGHRLSSLASAAIRSFRCSPPPPSSPAPSDPPVSHLQASPPRASSVHSRSRHPRPSLPSRMEILTAYYRRRGFSKPTINIFSHGHADSTHRAYEQAWGLFRDYLSQRRIHPSRIRESDVFNFLTFHRRVFRRLYRTLTKYRAAIKLPILVHSKIQLDSDFNHLFMRGLCREVPPQRVPMPLWSLDFLLAYLCSDRFEPLEYADLPSVTCKALALLVMATGRRISCIAHLTRVSAPGTRNNLILFWPPSYRPKNFMQLENNKAKLGPFAATSPSIRQLDPEFPSHPLCPVRAYRQLLARTAGPNFSNTYLWDHGSDKEQVNVTKLSNTFRDLVAASQDYAHVPDAGAIGPHQGRKYAASYGFLCCNSLEDERKLMQAVGCSSLVVLRQTYINPVPPLSLPCVVPGGVYIPDQARTTPYRPYRNS